MVELELFEKKKVTYTRIKISQKSWKHYANRAPFKDLQQTKENSRYIYFEIVGDLINGR